MRKDKTIGVNLKPCTKLFECIKTYPPATYSLGYTNQSKNDCPRRPRFTLMENKNQH